MSPFQALFAIRNRSYLVACVIVLAFLVITRLWNINIFPAALTHDEMVYAVQAESLVVQGTTLNQQFHWWSLQPTHPDYAEAPAVLMTPFFKLISNPLVATRAISVLMGITFPFVLGLFSFGIWRNKKLSLVVIIVSSLNPLLWQMSRLTYDAVMSSYFYLLGGSIVLLVKGKKSLFALIPLFIGFFCYQGLKLVFIPWLALLGVLQFRSLKELMNQKYYIWILGICGLLFGSYMLFILPNQKVDNRWLNTIFANSDFQAKVTNEERRVAIDFPLKSLFSNKAVVIGKFLASRVIEAYSPVMLFVSGEPAQSAFSAWGYGWFHYFESVLLVLGVLLVLARKKLRVTGILLLLFMIVATVPATLNSGDPWFLLRMFFPNLFLIFFIAWGTYYLLTRFYWGKYLIASVYLIGLFSFMYHYYYRYPISGLNVAYFSERIMAEYIDRSVKANPDRKVIVYTIDPPVMFWTYLLYSHNIKPENLSQIAQVENAQDFKNYTIGNVTFTTECVDLGDNQSLILSEAIRAATPCNFDQSHFKQESQTQFQSIVDSNQNSNIQIPSLLDNGAYWKIYNNSLCDKKDLKRYVAVDQFKDLDPTTKNNQDFCSTWISNVN